MTFAKFSVSFSSNAINPSKKGVLGRESAIESFYASYLHHGGDGRLLVLENEADRAGAEQLLVRNNVQASEIAFCPGWDGQKSGSLGSIVYADPTLGKQAWKRRNIADNAYSLIGMTHTLSSSAVLDLLVDYHVAPIQPWDALVCTSTVARQSVERLLDHTADLIEERLGSRPSCRPQLPIIPLTIDCSRFEPTPGVLRDAAALRRQLGIQPDDCVFLYFGRFSFHAKANPAPMFVGLEQVAVKLAPKKIVILMVGQAPNQRIMSGFEQVARDLCSNVRVHFLDGRNDALCRAVWHAADVFVSLSDSIQETFGMTIIEAMAAGLPVIASDWNGYRDTVEVGVTGLTVRTVAAPPGAGEDLANRYASGELTYDRMMGYVGTGAVIDVADFVEAALALASDPARRRCMAAAGRARAHRLYDLAPVMAAYRDLADELTAIRTQATVGAERRRRIPDPMTIFADHPTRVLRGDDRVILPVPDATDLLNQALAAPHSSYATSALLPKPALLRLMAWLSVRVVASFDQIVAKFSALPQPMLKRSVAWMLKYGILRLFDEARVVLPPPTFAQGNDAYRRRDFVRAASLLREAVVAAPMDMSSRRNMVVALKGANRFDDAMSVTDGLLEDFPDHWQPHYEKGRLLVRAERFADAEREYRRALELRPEKVEIMNELAVCLRRQKREDDAEQILFKAIQVNPRYPLLYANKGNIALARRKYSEAIGEYEKVINIDPTNFGAMINIGVTYKRMGEMEKAERYLRKALEIEKYTNSAANNLGYLLLVQGKYKKGWEYYRKRISGSDEYKLQDIPDLEDMIGKTVHVLHDQGLGDEIFFLRFLPQLMERGVKVRYLPQKKIASVLKRTDQIGHVIVDKLPDEPVVFRMLCGDLPYVLRHDDGQPVPPSLTVRPLEQKLAAAQQLLSQGQGGPFVGVAWRGGTPDREIALYKEIPLQYLAATLRDYPGTIVILQRNPHPGEVEAFETLVGRPVIDATGYNDDLEMMLALTDLIDDMVGVSNTNVHLRAMCQKAADVFVPNPPDFRWYDGVPTTPWFPDMSVLRESRAGDWTPALVKFKTRIDQRRGVGALAPAFDESDAVIEPLRQRLLQGEYDQGLAEIEQKLADVPLAPRLLALKGAALIKLSRLQEAQEPLCLALAGRPQFVDALINMGVVQENIGSKYDAMYYYMAAEKNRPDLYQIKMNIANIQIKSKSYEDAINTYRELVATDPAYQPACLQLIKILSLLGRHEEAVEVIEKMLERFPNDARAWAMLASTRCSCEDITGAYTAFEKVRMLRNLTAGDYAILGRIYQEDRRERDAEQAFRKALELRPDHPRAQIGLIETLQLNEARQHELTDLVDDALRRQDEVGRYDPLLIPILLEMGDVDRAMHIVIQLKNQRDPEWQVQMMKVAIFLSNAGERGKADKLWDTLHHDSPGDLRVEHTRGLVHLTNFEFEKGWRYYLGRLSINNSRHFIDRELLQDDLRGRRFMLGREQGVGDELFLLRYVPELKRRGAWLGYVASPKTFSLCQRLPFLDQVVTSGRDLARTERRITIGDLPWLLQQFSRESIPPSLRLAATEEARVKIRQRLAEAGPPPYYGVAWQAGHRSRVALYKEVPRNLMARLFRDLPGTVICLQRQAGSEEIADFQAQLDRPMANFIDTEGDLDLALALMEQLDELIGVSNTNVHLRAMTGRPSRVLVPYPPDFRWMNTDGPSPWFPESIAYRKTRETKWSTHFEQLESDLKALYLA